MKYWIPVVMSLSIAACANCGASFVRIEHDVAGCAKAEVATAAGTIVTDVTNALKDPVSWRSKLEQLAIDHGLSVVLCAVDSVVNDLTNPPPQSTSGANAAVGLFVTVKGNPTDDDPMAIRGRAFLADHESFQPE